MVHADASNFAHNLTKQEMYSQVLDQVEALVKGQRNWVSNLANTSSILWHAYASQNSPLSSVNWAGFYVLDPSTQNQLILGPFMGKVACQTIAFNQGVCGKSATSIQSIVVNDVDTFPGHVKCDSDTLSEIVVPIFGDLNGEKTVVAVIDIDSKEKRTFDDVDKVWLEKLAHLLWENCDW
ncbi:Free methionine-R-sulfoxide reductase [Erysiphe neolycopersici]|uniref:Free methionine-R-sulfoxide reductase n=1 Tax=Erysiphe neolycopersici TaxID=212602 RepID=A0A420H7C8_9PEZI|nr:Free methionine-R-sulfoxide reductase [Erysiphe neolycopersici]